MRMTLQFTIYSACRRNSTEFETGLNVMSVSIVSSCTQRCVPGIYEQDADDDADQDEGAKGAEEDGEADADKAGFFRVSAEVAQGENAQQQSEGGGEEDDEREQPEKEGGAGEAGLAGRRAEGEDGVVLPFGGGGDIVFTDTAEAGKEAYGHFIVIRIDDIRVVIR